MSNTLNIITKFLGEALFPIAEAFDIEEEDIPGFIEHLGYFLPEVPPSLVAIQRAGEGMIDSLNRLDDRQDELEEGQIEEEKVLEAFALLLVDIGILINEIKNLPDNLRAELPQDYVAATGITDDIQRRLLEFAVFEALDEKFPGFIPFLEFFGILEPEVVGEDLDKHQPEHIRNHIFLRRIIQLFQEPSVLAGEVYGWGTSELNVEKLFENFQQLSTVFLYPAEIEYPSEAFAGALAPEYVIPEERDFDPQLILPLLIQDLFHIDLAVYPIPVNDQTEPQGLAFTIEMPVMLTEEMKLADGLSLKLESSIDLSTGFSLIKKPGQDVKLINDVLGESPAGLLSSGRFASEIAYGSETEGERLSLLSFPGGAAFDTQKFYLGTALEMEEGQLEDVYIELGLNGARLVINAEEGDGFLKKILPDSDLNANFDIAFRWSPNAGLHIKGSGAFDINIPVHIEVGPVEIINLTFDIQPKEEKLSLKLGSSIKAELGPILATVKEIGASIEFSSPDEGGNLGPVELALGFKPPTGLGLTVDGGGFKGGGFLDFDPDNERYSGMLELEYQDRIALKAIGLLTTRLPSGEDGFSLLIIITSEFTPIQLGFGFTLNGIGGLLGLNRTVQSERLRTGIRDNTLSSILFPQNIIANADRIISDLRQVFPPQEDRFVFGPMAKIGWGSPTLITIDLGLLIEVPNPVRLLILGVVKGLLPTEDEAVLRIQVNFLGVINFEKKQLSFDASLFDSTLLAYTLTGDMAMRLYWGADPNFLLTVGGFHPAYQPPPMNLPDLRRLTIQLLGSDNLRIKVENYFAVTSNTVQFGARTEVYAGAGKFNVYGFMSYDVLFQFSPFRFIADISAMLALRIGSSSFASIKLAFALEGPTPWKANGTASLKICWFLTIKVRFSKTWGAEQHVSLPDVEVMPLLLAALNDRGNWRAELPQARHMLVSTKEVAPEELQETILVHPHGLLRISQKVVPLNLRIEKFGNFRPADGNEFRISDVQIGSATVIPNPEPAEEYFAPAQFFEKEDAEKLSSPSFEQYDSGIRLQETEQLRSAYAAAREVKYELSYIDSQRDQRRVTLDELVELDPGAFNTWTLNGAIAQSDLSDARSGRPARAPEGVAVSGDQFGIAFLSDLQLFDDDSIWNSEAEALAHMKALIGDDPSLEGKIQIFPSFELNP